MMSKEASSKIENASSGYHIGTQDSAAASHRQLCEEMQKCYPPFDLKRFGIALLGVAAVFIIAAFVL